MAALMLTGQLIPHNVGGLVLLLIVAFTICQLSIYAYNTWLHPLSRFPGPRLAAISSLPKIRNALKGNGVHCVVDLHQKYGAVVRISPNELSFSSANSLKDIYGFKTAGRNTLPKDLDFYQPPGDMTSNLINSNDEGHSRQRRVFANAFSDRALKSQEPLFLTYVNALCDKIRIKIKQEREHKFNIVELYNFTTFDVMGDLTFGEPLGMLDNSSYHPWVASIFANFRFGTYLHCIRCYPKLANFLFSLIPQKIHEKRKMHDEFSHARVDQRLSKLDPRPDIWGLVLERGNKEGGGMTKEEMYANSNLFMLAGTETTATLLSGLTYYLLANPEKLNKLTKEVRQEFSSEEEITIERLQALSYLNACVEEGLRMFPPVSNGLPRLVPPEGLMIDGKYVPGGVSAVPIHRLSYKHIDFCIARYQSHDHTFSRLPQLQQLQRSLCFHAGEMAAVSSSILRRQKARTTTFLRRSASMFRQEHGLP